MASLLPFHGVLTALITPFQKQDALDLEALRVLVKRQVQHGVHGLVVCATTGEASTLTEEEQLQIIQTALEASERKVFILAGAGSNNTKKACDWQKRLESMQLDATLHVTPYYNKPTQEGLYRHFRAVSEASKTPVVLYNVPTRTGVDLEANTLLRIAEDCPNVVGIKECNLDPIRLQTYLSHLADNRPDFVVLGGEDAQFLSLLTLGGHGLIASGSNLAPKLFVEIYNAYCSQQTAKARKLSWQIALLTRWMFFKTHPIPVKTALASFGLINPSLRLPLCPLDPKEEQELKNALSQMDFLL